MNQSQNQFSSSLVDIEKQWKSIYSFGGIAAIIYSFQIGTRKIGFNDLKIVC